MADENTSSIDGSKAYYRLTINLKEAHELIAMDKCGTSDPYVKVKVDKQTVYKTKKIKKTLDPVWNESCQLTLENLSQEVGLKLYDYDKGSLSDDFLGQVEIDLCNHEINKVVQHKLKLFAKRGSSKKSINRGYIILTTHLEQLGPADVKQDKEKPEHQPESENIFKQIMTRKWTISGRSSSHHSVMHVLEVVLVHINKLHVPVYSHTQSPLLSSEGDSSFSLRLSCGSESHRAKSLKPADGSRAITKICQRFSFDIRTESVDDLHLELFDGNDVIGKATVRLADLAIEQTHKVKEKLSNNCGQLLMTITLTGTKPELITAMGHLPAPTWTPFGPPIIRDDVLRAEEATWFKALHKVFSLKNTAVIPNSPVGVLVLKVIQASNVISADVNGKSDPFCVIEIVNVKLRTHTEYKTLNPKWNRTYLIPIDDVHTMLTINVFDDDGDKKPDFLGKMIIPLLRLYEMNGARKWFALRSRRLSESTDRGKIEIEGHLFYNKPRAVVRALDPNEQSYFTATKEDKITIKLLQQEMDRVNFLFDMYDKAVDFYYDLMSWKNPSNTIMTIVFWIILCLCFDPWMAPFVLSLGFIATYLMSSSNEATSDEDEDEDDDEKVSLIDKVNRLQEICLTFHKIMDHITSVYERVKNVALWRSPWVATIVLGGLLIASMIFFFLPLRFLLMMFGLYELTKTKVRPSAGFEIHDLLLRAATDAELKKLRNPLP